jgi:hypothetical protein
MPSWAVTKGSFIEEARLPGLTASFLDQTTPESNAPRGCAQSLGHGEAHSRFVEPPNRVERRGIEFPKTCVVGREAYLLFEISKRKWSIAIFQCNPGPQNSGLGINATKPGQRIQKLLSFGELLLVIGKNGVSKKDIGVIRAYQGDPLDVSPQLLTSICSASLHVTSARR